MISNHTFGFQFSLFSCILNQIGFLRSEQLLNEKKVWICRLNDYLEHLEKHDKTLLWCYCRVKLRSKDQQREDLMLLMDSLRLTTSGGVIDIAQALLNDIYFDQAPLHLCPDITFFYTHSIFIPDQLHLSETPCIPLPVLLLPLSSPLTILLQSACRKEA